jgi:Ca2+-binding RTX toxin-like protein
MKGTPVLVALFCSFFASETADTQRPGGGFVSPTLKCGGATVTIVGTNGDDVIVGTAGPDVIAGLAGNDIIRGGGFDDVICGGPGDDYIEGQGGEDILLGEGGNDVLDGGEAGCCAFSPNTGDDVISGGPGNDVIYASEFPQAGSTLYGDEGNDRIHIWDGNIALNGKTFAYGGPGNDVIIQRTGDAVIDGEAGKDLIIDGDDDGEKNETLTIEGGSGKDRLVSEDDNSTANMDGGPAHDICVDGDATANCEAIF